MGFIVGTTGTRIPESRAGPKYQVSSRGGALYPLYSQGFTIAEFPLPPTPIIRRGNGDVPVRRF